ncbi:hypothetical protein CERSUDRAFT_85543 [Gelatoporia subvermispora B]|uniref:DUF7729 domain-containing protein n=1 Tax=Ceriporiopsis subvermispora (strain B) TaxID=914234 RepID=M2RB01_CERS8|nr:hypothetical protein CERSUDRAFT_85543 [Gelatoporia subvermispora B]
MFTPPPSPAPPEVSQKQSCTVPLSSLSSYVKDDVFLSPTSSSGPSSSWLRSSFSHLPQTPLRETPSPPPPCSEQLHARSVESKKRTGRRTRWTILLVPAILIFITASTRYLSHPAALDALSPDYAAEDWQTWTAALQDWRPHKRHPFPQGSGEEPATNPIVFPSGVGPGVSTASTVISTPSLSVDPSVASSVSPAAPSSSATDGPTPTIPMTPPVLPTPFPQPLDTIISQNFSSEGCLDFFTNMTQTGPFLTCRPFSLLLQLSSAFINAQTNISLLNTIVWGTCNTDPTMDECIANMEWFATALQQECTTELKGNYATVVNTLMGLQSYSVLRQAACAPDPVTNGTTYCYISAMLSSSRADAYYYTLPLDIALPNNSIPSCSTCTQNLMDLYVLQGTNNTGLEKTYDAAAAITDNKCGGGFAKQAQFNTTSSSSASRNTGIKTCWMLASILAIITAVASA